MDGDRRGAAVLGERVTLDLLGAIPTSAPSMPGVARAG